MILAPDFPHGDFVVEDAYQLFAQDPDAIAFIVLDDDGVGVGLYHDHFLSVHTCREEPKEGSVEGGVVQRFVQRLLSHRADVVARALILDLRQQATFPTLVMTPAGMTTRTFHLDRTRWTHDEERLLHVYREQSAVQSTTTRLQNDVLSWIALSSRTTERVSPDAQAA